MAKHSWHLCTLSKSTLHRHCGYIYIYIYIHIYIYIYTHTPFWSTLYMYGLLVYLLRWIFYLRCEVWPYSTCEDLACSTHFWIFYLVEKHYTLPNYLMMGGWHDDVVVMMMEILTVTIVNSSVNFLSHPFTMSSVRVQSCWPPRCNQEMPDASSRCHLQQDLLGFNVTYTVVAGTVESYMSVAGCATPGNATDRGCGPEGPSVAWWRFAVRLVPRAGISFLLSRKPADRQGLVVGCERSEFRGSGGSGWLLPPKWWKFKW